MKICNKFTILMTLVVMLSGLFGTEAFAASVLRLNDSAYVPVVVKETDFSGDSLNNNTNNKGCVEKAVLDDEHGTSIMVKSDPQIEGEGPWVELKGDTQSLCMYEFEMYIDNFDDGQLKFTRRVNWWQYPVYIDKNGITANGTDYEPFELGQWHKLRFIYDGNDYYVYVDGADTYAISGSFKGNPSSPDNMRIALWANNMTVYIDNFKFYHLNKMIDGYEKPAVTLSCDTESVTESLPAKISASVESKVDINKVDFYVGDELAFTDTEAPFEFERIYEKGTYTVRAVAEDIYGETGEDSIDITSAADTKPLIKWSLENNISYEKADLESMSAQITMTDAELVKCIVEADGETVAELTLGDNTFDLSHLSIGRHEIRIFAENNLGETAEKKVVITVNRKFDDAVWTADFNDGSTSGWTNGSGQFVRTEVIRQDFGESQLVGANTTQNTNVEGALAEIKYQNINTVATAEYDLYFNDINGNGMTAMLCLDGNNAVRPVLFTVNKDGLVSSSGKILAAFEAKKWYHIKSVVDSQNAVCTLYLDGEELLTNEPLAKMNKGEKLNSVRLVSKLQGTEETYFAVDNIVVRETTLAPTILNVTSENGGENIVSAKDSVIMVYFSGALQPTSVYPAKFTIDGAVIKSAHYDDDKRAVIITLDKPLAKGKHRVTTAENLVMGNGEIYAEKLFADFEVKANDISVVTAEISNGQINAELVNDTGADINGYMITNLYDGTGIKSTTVKNIVLKSGTTNISETIQKYEIGNGIEVFIWDSLKNPECLMYAED